MIIDLILDRKDDEVFHGENSYNAHDFYMDVMRYGKIGHGITSAMDYGTEADVKRELCEYIVNNEYNKEICDYINSRKWIE